MIPNFKTYIKESVWGGILDRGTGKLRKEDDINHLDTEEFAEYLKTHYKVKNDLFGIKYAPSESIHVDLFCDLKNNSYRGVYIDVDDHKLYTTQNSIRQWPEHLLHIINKKYERIDTIEYVYIKPKRHKVDNNFFLDFIDTIISNSETPLLKKIDVNESIWGGMLDRGSGDKIRKEDDVDGLDFKEFSDYLKNHYEVQVDNSFFEIEQWIKTGTNIGNISIPIEANNQEDTPNLGNRMLNIQIDLNGF